MTSVNLGSANADGMRLELHRRDDVELPYVLEVDGTPWALAFEEAHKFTSAARCRSYPPGKHHKDGARFTHDAAMSDGRVFQIQLGVGAGEGHQPDSIWFVFDGKRASGTLGEPGELTRLLSAFAEDVVFLSHTGFGGGGGGGLAGAGHGAGIDPNTFESGR